MAMLKIVIFGDSNTWGFDPATGLRQPGCFTSLMAKAHPEWEIAVNGLNGRLMYTDDPYFKDLDGASQLARFLDQQVPYNLLVIALGANDARRMFHASLASWSQAFGKLAEIAVKANKKAFQSIGQSCLAPILFVQPPAFGLNGYVPGAESYGDSGRKILAQCGMVMSRIAAENGCYFLDVQSQEIQGASLDGIHLDSHSHARMADILANWIEQAEKQGLLIEKKEGCS